MHLLITILMLSLIAPMNPLRAEEVVPNEQQALALINKCGRVEDFQKTGRGNAVEQVEISFCVGYLAGLTEALSLAQALNENKLKHLPCLKQGVSNEQYIRVLEKLANDAPQMLNDPRAVFATLALASSYPCN